ncbi:hypothetical protein ASD00_32130 [Ensifer sp. Root31]|uniref:ABC transporter permease n=1 Tax=Ensifer sp. Root31 TaxID=1736512 RepID=UPI00070EA4F4|nr:ABC transporter permease [Ensifer sp. Root31]KQU85641.1 hypothetical protein ASD00_32130 [Ensifer sp. Root31]
MANTEALKYRRSGAIGKLPASFSEATALVGTIVLICGVTYLYAPAVISIGNVANVLTQASYLSLFAAAQLIVIISRGFDLSLSATVSTASVGSALIMTSVAPDGFPILLGLFGALAIGGAVGLANGSIVAFGKINPFIATLVSLNVLLAISSTMSGGFPVSQLPNGLSYLSSGRFYGIPVPVAATALTLWAVYILLTKSVFGRQLYVVGANPSAALVAGIPVRRVLVGAYVLCSVLAAFGAFMLTARTGSGEPNLGGNLALQSIAAAVLGGASLQGGKGGISSALLGALLVTVLSNAMNLLVINGYLQQIILGVTIIGALAADRLRSQ